MTARTAARRRRHLSANLVVVLALLALGAAYAAFLAPSSGAVEGEPAAPVSDYSPEQVSTGRALYEVGCSSCHGLNAEGTSQGPSLIGVGAASVDFQVGTGRMPLARTGPQADEKQVVYTQDQIDALAAYVASLAPGPAVPQVDVAGGDLALGRELFQNNCASCHSASANGGALTFGKYAPSLADSTPTEIVEAMLSGPSQMPVFPPAQYTAQDYDSLAAYIVNLHGEANPGGAGLGRIGPVTEGLLIWVVGIGALLGMTLWIGARA